MRKVLLSFNSSERWPGIIMGNEREKEEKSNQNTINLMLSWTENGVWKIEMLFYDYKKKNKQKCLFDQFYDKLGEKNYCGTSIQRKKERER